MKCKDGIINELAQENSYLRDENKNLLQKIENEMTQKEKLLHDNREQEQMTYRQIADKDEEIEQLRQQKQQLEHEKQQLHLQRQQAEKEKLELVRQLAQAQQPKLEAVQFSQDSWNVRRREVVLQNELGRGAWGTVFKGLFHKRPVAVKCAHEEILHKTTIDKLKREIRIMAHIQHPNLTRLLAAVVDESVERGNDSPLLVLELMDIDLRSAYKQKFFRFSKNPLVSIFREIAYALHYLHEHQEPIIHRDVSAPNVLLQKISPGVLKAKLSDFGSANLAKDCKTLATGAIVYAAPETIPPSNPHSPPPKQTTKIDVFSYGYLLVEAVGKKMPSADNRSTMLEDIKKQWRQLYDIIIACIEPQPEDRLTMTQVLEKLNVLNLS